MIQAHSQLTRERDFDTWKCAADGSWIHAVYSQYAANRRADVSEKCIRKMLPTGMSLRNNYDKRDTFFCTVHAYPPQELRSLGAGKFVVIRFGLAYTTAMTRCGNFADRDLFQFRPASNRPAPIRAIPVSSPTRIDRLRRRCFPSATGLARAEPSAIGCSAIVCRLRNASTVAPWLPIKVGRTEQVF